MEKNSTHILEPVPEVALIIVAEKRNCPSSVRELFRKEFNSARMSLADCDSFLGLSRAELVGVTGGIRLENHCTGNRTGGSNPPSSVLVID